MSGSNPLAAALGNVGQGNPLQYAAGYADLATKAMAYKTQLANQAIGGILQQATDANGNVDYEMAGRLAAQAGPQVQMGMQSYLQNASVMRGQQLAQGLSRNQAAGNAIIGALNGSDDGLHDRVVGGLQSLVANGVMTQDQATRSALRLPSDPAQLRQRLTQIQTSLAPPDLQQQQIYGQPFDYTAPGGNLAGGTRNIRTGALSTPPQPGVQQGLSPAQNQPVTWTDSNNVLQHTTLQDYQTAIQQGRAKGSAFDVNGQPIAGTGNMPPAAAPRQPTSSSTAPPAPPPGTTLQGSTTGAYKPPQATPQGGRTAAPPNQPPPAQTTQNQPPSPASPPSLSGPSVATTTAQTQDQTAYGNDIADMQNMNRRNVAGKAALDALELARTGPGTSTVAQKLAFLQAQGIPLPFGNDPNDYSSAANYQVLQKNLLRFAQDSSQRSGTDLGLETQLHSNANAEAMLPAANRHVVIQDMGLLRQRMAMVKGQDASGVGYRDRAKNFPTDTDSTAFAWDIMNPSERQAYLTQIDPKGTQNTPAYKKWAQSMRIARAAGVFANQPNAQ